VEKKRRAAQLLALAADARARFAAATVGRVAHVLVETQLEDGRWLGHAEDYVPVVVRPRIGDPPELEHAILRVRRVAVDREMADRVVGEIESLDLPSSRPRPTLPVLDSSRRSGPAGRRARHSAPTPAQAPAAGGFDVR
jgi:hypothetical protein